MNNRLSASSGVSGGGSYSADVKVGPPTSRYIVALSVVSDPRGPKQDVGLVGGQDADFVGTFVVDAQNKAEACAEALMRHAGAGMGQPNLFATASVFAF